MSDDLERAPVAADDERMVRAFVAVEMSAAARAAIRETQARLRDALNDGGRSLRWVDPETAHVTLKFLGPTRASALGAIEQALREALREASVAPFELETGGLGAFPGPRSPRVLWLGLEGDVEALRAARDAVETAIAPLGWPTESRPFTPHLTLARVRPDASPAALRGIGRAFGTVWTPDSAAVPVAAVSVMESQLGPGGPRYERLAGIPLG